jgi:hypothetical protein
MAFQIQLRRGTASAWSTVNPILVEGEVGLESDTNKMKVGNGSTAWNSLSYAPIGTITSNMVTTALGYTPASTGKSIAMSIVFGG